MESGYKKIRIATVMSLIVLVVCFTFLSLLSVWEVFDYGVAENSIQSIAIIIFSSALILIATFEGKGKFLSSFGNTKTINKESSRRRTVFGLVTILFGIYLVFTLIRLNVPSINKTLFTNTPSISASEQYASLLAEQCPKLRADKGNYTEYYNCKQDMVQGMEFALINELKRKLPPHQTLALKRLDLGGAPSRILFEFKNKDSSGSYTLGDLQERADRTNNVISAQIRQGGVLGESLVNTASAHASVMENSVWLSYSTETILNYPEEFYAFWSAEIVPIFYE